MRVPLLDLKAQLHTLGDELKAAVMQVIDSTAFIMGPAIEQLETAVAKYSGTKSAIAVSSGTDALLVSLMALDVGQGDLVITSPYSFFATAGVVARLGAKPVLVDIDRRTYNMSPEALEQWFVNNPQDVSKVKAIMPVHLFGQCADMDPIMAIADQRGIPVIEDAAQAIGSRYPSKSGVKFAGTMGKVACFSFFPSKNLGGIGDGGMVATNDEQLAEKIRLLRNHGSKPKYYHSMIGGNFRLDTIQAAALLVKLPHLNTWHQQRAEHAQYYDETLKVSGLQTPYIAYRREYHIYNQYVIQVPDRREDLRKFLTSREIGSEVYYPVSFHEQQCFRYLGYNRGDFPNSEFAAAHSLAIPVYPELTTEMQDYVVSQIREFYGN